MSNQKNIPCAYAGSLCPTDNPGAFRDEAGLYLCDQCAADQTPAPVSVYIPRREYLTGTRPAGRRYYS